MHLGHTPYLHKQENTGHIWYS